MARIRTIKPEFWTDATMVALPFEARLFFIGLWNFADDSGRFEDEPERLRMQILPDDSVDPGSLLYLLEAAGRIELCEDDSGDRHWRICHFANHQKIDHPGKSKFGEASRKRAIPAAARRDLARKYGCPPGGQKTVECFYCAAPGSIHWWTLKNNKPSGWVSFSLEIDHVEAEATGGANDVTNLVLACRHCNRTKGFLELSDFLARSREVSRSLAPEGKGKEVEGKGKEVEREAEPAKPALTAKIPVTVIAPTKPPEGWDGDDFWAWCQSIRQDAQLVAEAKPGSLSAWFNRALMTEGVTVHALKEAFYAFGRDKHWEANRFPFKAFMQQWASFARKDVKRVAS